ncbi:hypothetical protein MSAN_02234500 [Mycena sanguinolenta]|uniref:F-box domain-containing protein n=1 Tax=Mycena sanguinolenta TaxID=230812 RepID=A0A8H6XBK7_9AGAR|nr:hypothetical protein MSAN_02234500 [Mycena sanguinolenta]
MQSKPVDASRDNNLESFNAIPTVPPIHRIPYELLSDIMLCVLTLHWESDEWGTDDYDWIIPSQLLRLCSICQRWRQVALTSPRLWTLEFFPLLPDYGETSVAINGMFLKHSAQSAISIQLYSDTHPQRETIDELVSAAHRWKSFNVFYDHVPALFDSEFLARMAVGGMQSLEELFLRTPPWPEMATRLDIFQHAPRLRDVGLQMDGTISQIPPLPWTQLTRLALKYMSPQLCLDILVRCENLVHGRFETDQWQRLPRDTSTCVLKYMEELEISIDIRSVDEHLDPFLRHLELPALKSLTLRLYFYRHPEYARSILWLAPTLNTFLTKSPRVERLELCDCAFAEDVPEILRHTPFLTHLCFNPRFTGDIHDEFFEALWYDSTAPDAMLVPKLENLELYNTGVDFGEESVLEMIESRWASDEDLANMDSPSRVARLKQVSFHSYMLEPPLQKFSEAFMEKISMYQGFTFEWYQ